MMGKMQREKGKRGEREVVKFLKALGIEAKRNLNTEADHDAGDADIVLSRFPDIAVDVKLRTRVPRGVFAEVEERFDGTGKIPLTVWRTDGDTQWRATLKLEDLCNLLLGSGSEGDGWL